MGILSGPIRSATREASKKIRKMVRPKREPVDIVPLTEGTPLIGGGRSRAPAPAEQTGGEVPLTIRQKGVGNVARRAEESGRVQAVEDTNMRDLKFGVGVTVGAAGTAGGIAGIKRLLMSDSAASKDFKSTFADARRNDEKTFTWRGQKYTTQTVEEVAGLKGKRVSKPKPKPKPPARKAHGGMQSKKRTGHADFRKGGLFYK
tara:strand:- start:2524 stop:3132 length:609 start_codon:yes stop_codon:yes gene_type:complete